MSIPSLLAGVGEFAWGVFGGAAEGEGVNFSGLSTLKTGWLLGLASIA